MAIIPTTPAIRQGYDPSVASSYLNAAWKPMISAVDSGEKRLVLTN
jgi:hypothetical protein